MIDIADTDGLVLKARRWGSGTAPAIWLIHGFGDGSYVWSRFARLLTPPTTLIAHDLRGHGDSARDPSHRYAVETHVDDAIRVLEVTCPDPIILIGHSLGAEVAVHVAVKCPEHIRALVLVDVSTDNGSEGILQLRRQFTMQPWHYATVDGYLEVLQGRLPLASRETLHEFAHQALRFSPNGFDLKCDPALKVGIGQPDSCGMLLNSLRAVECPILIARGSASALLSANAARKLAGIPRAARLTTIPLAGHAIPLDNPWGLHAATHSFILDHLPRHRRRTLLR